VERVADPSDARARLVRITVRGRQTLPLAATVVSDVEAEWTEYLGKRHMGQLREILARLREITDPVRPIRTLTQRPHPEGARRVRPDMSDASWRNADRLRCSRPHPITSVGNF
jgi:hypothetical protein